MSEIEKKSHLGTIGLKCGGMVDCRGETPVLVRATLADIAEGLARIPRFLGQLGHESVLEHSLKVWRIAVRLGGKYAKKEIELYALMHDAHEAFLGDLPAPLKKHLPGFKELEHKLSEQIYDDVLDMPYPDEHICQTVKVYDRAALAAYMGAQKSLSDQYQKLNKHIRATTPKKIMQVADKVEAECAPACRDTYVWLARTNAVRIWLEWYEEMQLCQE